jgi:7-cyano-7-deazaguanine synthase in queuosine biosynthesis
MSAKPRLDVVLLDKYTTPALGSYTPSDNILKLLLSGEDANVKMHIEDIEVAIESKMHPLVEDFYRIALAVYIADRWFKRSGKIPNRTIRFLVSVSDLRMWDQHKDTLRAVLYQLSGDNLIFDFVQGAKGRAFSFKQSSEGDRVVSLFSGGLDSLAGVCWLRDKKLRPILVAHWSHPKVARLQNTLVAELRAPLKDGLEFRQLNAVPDKKKLQWSEGKEEYSQKLRSFLYLTLGCVFGLHEGIASLYVFENGILAINVPASSSRIFLNTQTTHPTFLRMYQEMVSEIFGLRLEVINPFLDKTKGQVIALLNDGGLGRLIKSTISCGDIRTGVVMAGQPISKIWHCGVCVPCIVRRAGIHAAGIPDKQDAEYSKQVLTDYDSLEQTHRNVISELLNFGRKLKRDSEIGMEEVLDDFPAFRVEGFAPDHFIPMYLRYVDELGSFFRSCPALRHNITW